MIHSSRWLLFPGMRPPDIVSGLAEQARGAIACPPRRNGNGRRAGALKGSSSLGAMRLRQRAPAIPNVGGRGRKGSVAACRMRMACMKCARTCMSGLTIGFRPIITRTRRNVTHPGPKGERGVPLGEGRGGTTSKSRAALRVPAFHRNFNMRTTDFAWPAI